MYLRSKRIHWHKNFSFSLSTSADGLFDGLPHVRCVVTRAALCGDASRHVPNDRIFSFNLARKTDLFLDDESFTIFTTFTLPEFHYSFSFSHFFGRWLPWSDP